MQNTSECLCAPTLVLSIQVSTTSPLFWSLPVIPSVARALPPAEISPTALQGFKWAVLGRWFAFSISHKCFLRTFVLMLVSRNRALSPASHSELQLQRAGLLHLVTARKFRGLWQAGARGKHLWVALVNAECRSRLFMLVPARVYPYRSPFQTTQGEGCIILCPLHKHYEYYHGCNRRERRACALFELCCF